MSVWELNFEKLGSALCELLTESVKKGILFFSVTEGEDGHKDPL